MKTVAGQKLIPEERVIEIWRRQLLAHNKLVTTQGIPVAVLYPGDMEASCGPDFRQAIVCLGRSRPVRGDIEVHVRSSEWQNHKHHQDPAYNGVILHVVLWDDSKLPTPLKSGSSAPVIELANLLPDSMEQVYQQLSLPWAAEEPCYRAGKLLSVDALADVLDVAGEERFRLKAALMREDFGSKGAEQTLYEHVMSALGYSRNKQPFLKLAQRLPLSMLTSMAIRESPVKRIRRLQALLLGTAGLLPGQCSCRDYLTGGMSEWNELEQLWSKIGSKQAMSQSEWCLSGIRPSNSPRRRIVAASYLVHRYLDSGWLQGIQGLVVKAPISERGHKEVEKGFLVPAGACGTGTINLGSACFKMPPVLLGPDRAAEIVVNVVLPFCYAWAQTTQQAELGGKALALYQSYAANGENRVIRQMLQRIWQAKASPFVNTAARQQGLIHLYQSFCLERKCAFCPLGSRVNPA